MDGPGRPSVGTLCATRRPSPGGSGLKVTHSSGRKRTRAHVCFPSPRPRFCVSPSFLGLWKRLGLPCVLGTCSCRPGAAQGEPGTEVRETLCLSQQDRPPGGKRMELHAEPLDRAVVTWMDRQTDGGAGLVGVVEARPLRVTAPPPAALPQPVACAALHSSGGTGSAVAPQAWLPRPSRPNPVTLRRPP